MPEIDVLVYTEALVSLYRFLPPDDSIPVFRLWLEPKQSEAVKSVVMRACLQLIEEVIPILVLHHRRPLFIQYQAPRFPWMESLDALEKGLRVQVMETYNSVCETLLTTLYVSKSCFQAAGVRQTDYARNLSLRPRALRDQSALSDREQLLLAVIQIGCVRPAFFMGDMNLHDVELWLKMSLNLWETNIDPAIKAALAKSCYIVAEVAFSASSEPEFVPLMVACTKLVLYVLSLPYVPQGLLTRMRSPTNLMSIAKNLLHARRNVEDQKLWTNVSLRILELYIRPVEVCFP